MKTNLAIRNTSLLLGSWFLVSSTFGCDSNGHTQTDDDATHTHGGYDDTGDGSAPVTGDGSAPEAGDPTPDAGARADGGTEADGGSRTDAGVDPGAHRDAGLGTLDAGALDGGGDAGAPDAAADAGEQVDTALDAGTSVDASTCTQKVDECGVCGGYGLPWWYPDVDGDGFGEPSGGVQACTPPPGYVWSINDPDPACPNRRKDIFLATTEDATVSSLHREPGWGARLSTWGAESRAVEGTREVTRSYIRFDLSPLLYDAEILFAGMGLYLPSDLESGLSVGDNRGRLAAVVEPWDEDSLSWDHQPRFVNDAQLLHQTSVFSSWGLVVTDEVIHEHGYPTHYSGFVLTREDEQSDGILRFSSVDHPNKEAHPELHVEYVDSESESCGLCRGYGRRVLYRDVDGDGLGDAAERRFFCTDEDSTGFVRDSNDLQPTCATNDEDDCGVCGGPGSVAYYRDVDGDGMGDASKLRRACSPLDGYVLMAGDPEPDCATNDTDSCGVCAGPGPVDLYEDLDHDGLGTPGVIDHGCVRTGYADNDEDSEPTCPTNDTDVCGQCSGPGLVPWYEDKDGDGLGDPSSGVQACSAPPGRVARGDDPDDACRTIASDVTVATSEQVAAISDVCHILGALSVTPGLASLTLPVLRFVQRLEVKGSPDLERLSLPALASAGSVVLYETPKLVNIDLPNLASVSEDLSFVYGPPKSFDMRLSSLVSVGGMVNLFLPDGAIASTDELFPVLRHAGNIWMSGARTALFSSFGFPALETVDGIFYLFYGLTEEDGREGRAYLPALRQVGNLTFVWGRKLEAPSLESAREIFVGGLYQERVDLPRLRGAHAIHFDSGIPMEVSLPALEQLDTLSSETAYSAFDAPQLRGLGYGGFPMAQHAVLELAALETVLGVLYVNAETVRLDSLTEVGGNLELGSARSVDAAREDTMLSWSSAALARIGGALVVRNTELSELALPSLSSVGVAQKQSTGIDSNASLAIANNASLAHLALPNLQTAPGVLTFLDNPMLSPCDVLTLESRLGKPLSGDVSACR